jgi:hypothetical protein
MWGSINRVFERLDPVTNTTALRDVVVIRPARDAELAQLHDLAELDSAAPLAGPVLVAAVDGALWAALALDDDRVIADPFRPTAGAVELLRMRVAQLRAAEGRGAQGGLRLLRGARRARARA